MMRTIERLFESYLRKKNHADGTYISAAVSSQGKEDLYRWVKENGITNLTSPDDYHATIIYSRKGIPEVKGYNFDLPIHAKITGWHIFPTQTGGKCLVAALKSDSLTKIHKDIMDKYEATYDFPEYKPHITVSYDYKGNSIPSTFPSMHIKFNKVSVDALDPQFRPKKD